MGPAQKGLDGGDPTAAEFELRLVVQLELAFFDGDTQLFAETPEVPALIEIRVVDGEGGIAQFGAIHRYVGAPQKLGGIRRVLGSGGHTDTGADTGADALEHERLLDAGHEALGNGRGIVGVGVHENNAELIPTEPHEHLWSPEHRREARAQLLQKLVAGRVAEGVVDLLEIVEVDEEKSQPPLCFSSVALVAEERLEDLDEVAPIPQTGQFVGE